MSEKETSKSCSNTWKCAGNHHFIVRIHYLLDGEGSKMFLKEKVSQEKDVLVPYTFRYYKEARIQND